MTYGKELLLQNLTFKKKLESKLGIIEFARKFEFLC